MNSTLSFDGKRRLPFHEQADGTLVCRHRDTCVCPACQATYADEISDVYGQHYAIPPHVAIVDETEVDGAVVTAFTEA